VNVNVAATLKALSWNAASQPARIAVLAAGVILLVISIRRASR
jgi:hypothetical protein